MNIDQRLKVLKRRLEATAKRQKDRLAETERVFWESRDVFNHPTFRFDRAAPARWAKQRVLAKEITKGTKELLRVVQKRERALKKKHHV
jgi:hypothetical protein